jgi:hypothetical protein
MLLSTFLSDRLLVPAMVAGLVLIAVGAAMYVVHLLRG